MKTMTHPSLTDRYVAAVMTGVPGSQRPDVTTRLRAAIAEAVDTRVAGGAAPG